MVVPLVDEFNQQEEDEEEEKGVTIEHRQKRFDLIKTVQIQKKGKKRGKKLIGSNINF